MRDVVVIGGSFAGLTAALQLGRANRGVTVIDAGRPRNRMSAGAHGLPGWDGSAPLDILSRFRRDADSYPTVDLVENAVTNVAESEDGFDVHCASGQTLKSHRVILAHGVNETLPNIPGITALWGKSVLHCPYCHGFEVRFSPLAVLANHPMSFHQAELLRTDWSADVTLLTGFPGAVASEDVDPTRFTIERRPIARLTPAGDRALVHFNNGSTAAFAAIFVAPQVSLAESPADWLGCATSAGPLGAYVQVGPMGQTSIPGVFAAGDCARPAHNVTSAIGDGAIAGVGCHQSFIFPNMIQPLEVSSHD